jgi:hypothetical protein
MLAAALLLQAAVDLSRHDDACGIKLERKGDILRRGDVFVTTGERLEHAFAATDGTVSADLERTFPLRRAEISAGDVAFTQPAWTVP